MEGLRSSKNEEGDVVGTCNSTHLHKTSVPPTKSRKITMKKSIVGRRERKERGVWEREREREREKNRTGKWSTALFVVFFLTRKKKRF